MRWTAVFRAIFMQKTESYALVNVIWVIVDLNGAVWGSPNN
jgi:hypothetical protein